MNTEKLEPLKQITNVQTGTVNPNSEVPHDNELHLDMHDSEKTLSEDVEEKQPTIEEVLADPKVKEMAVFNAKMIEEKMRGNWFTLDQMGKKCGFKDYMVALDVMNLLCLFGLAYRKEKIKGTLSYKITFSKENRLALLNEELVEAELHVSRIKDQISSISNKD